MGKLLGISGRLVANSGRLLLRDHAGCCCGPSDPGGPTDPDCRYLADYRAYADAANFARRYPGVNCESSPGARDGEQSCRSVPMDHTRPRDRYRSVRSRGVYVVSMVREITEYRALRDGSGVTQVQRRIEEVAPVSARYWLGDAPTGDSFDTLSADGLVRRYTPDAAPSASYLASIIAAVNADPGARPSQAERTIVVPPEATAWLELQDADPLATRRVLVWTGGPVTVADIDGLPYVESLLAPAPSRQVGLPIASRAVGEPDQLGSGFECPFVHLPIDVPGKVGMVFAPGNDVAAVQRAADPSGVQDESRAHRCHMPIMWQPISGVQTTGGVQPFGPFGGDSCFDGSGALARLATYARRAVGDESYTWSAVPYSSPIGQPDLPPEPVRWVSVTVTGTAYDYTVEADTLDADLRPEPETSIYTRVRTRTTYRLTAPSGECESPPNPWPEPFGTGGVGGALGAGVPDGVGSGSLPPGGGVNPSGVDPSLALALDTQRRASGCRSCGDAGGEALI